MYKGWIKLDRAILDHWIWQDEKYFRRWMSILLLVNHTEKKFPVGNELFVCGQGESFRSIHEWSRVFGCSKPTVLKFFKLLEKEDMIRTKILGNGNRRKHLLTVVNWDKYQNSETGNHTERKLETSPERNSNLPPNKNDNQKRNNNDNILMSDVDESTLDDSTRSYFKIAHSFWSLIRKNLESLNLGTTTIDGAKFDTWVDPIRLLVERDKRSLEEIREVYAFIRDDEFWIKQIRSTEKLRKKKDGEPYFDKMLLLSRSNGRKKGSQKITGKEDHSSTKSVFKTAK